MRVTITEYKSLPLDANGRPMVAGNKERLAVQTQTAAGAFAALNADTRVIRFATDTNVIVDINSSAVDELFPIGVDFLAVNGGDILTTAAA